MPEENTVSATELPGLARALVSAGKLALATAEDLYSKAGEHKISFIAELTSSGAISAADLAHSLSQAFAVPLIDIDALDPKRLQLGLLDARTCLQYRVLPLGRRGNRISIATADPTDQQAAEKVKFATQLGIDWVVAEFDKLGRLVEATAASTGETMEQIIGSDF